MSSLSFEITSFIKDFNPTSATIEQIEKLEDYISLAVDKYQNNTGIIEVADSIYDEMLTLLEQANPDSEYVKEIWESKNEEMSTEPEEYKELFNKNPMYSILTCKNVESNEFIDFALRQRTYESEVANGIITYHFSMKLNGWGIRLVYKDGKFVSATSRARSASSRGRNLTKQLTNVLKLQNLYYIDDLKDLGLVEFRAELVVPFSKMNEARLYNDKIVSPFSAVSSMVKDSSSEEENSTLDVVVYTMYSNEIDFETKSEEYDTISNLGFKVPKSFVIDMPVEDLAENVKDIVDEISEEVLGDIDGEPKYDYFTDGLVLQVDDYELFRSMGNFQNKYNNGNIALKIGLWSQEGYNGYLQYIQYTKGKQNFIPVAIIADEPNKAVFKVADDYIEGYEELVDYLGDLELPIEKYIDNYDELGVPTASGNVVRRVPLYTTANVLSLGLEIGSVIHFKYGGEAGVVPCKEDGSNIKDKNTGSSSERAFLEQSEMNMFQ